MQSKQHTKEGLALTVANYNPPYAPTDVPKGKTPKSATKPKPKKTKKGTRKSKPQQGMSSRSDMAQMVQTCSILDPFCIHAYGARYPDGNANQTLTYQSRFIAVLSTQSNGITTCVAAPDIHDYNWMKGTITTNPTTFSTEDPAWTTAYNLLEAGRIVSAGVILHWTYPDSTSKPLVVVSEINDGSDVLSSTSITTLVLSGGGNAKLISTDKDYYWVCKKYDDTKLEFVPRGTATSSSRSRKYSALKIDIQGAASTNYGYAEVVINYEYTVSNGAAVAQYASRPPPANPVAVRASQTATTMLGSGQTADNSNDFSDFLKDLGKTAVTEMVSVGGDALLALLM